MTSAAGWTLRALFLFVLLSTVYANANKERRPLRPRPRIHVYDMPDHLAKPCWWWGCRQLTSYVKETNVRAALLCLCFTATALTEHPGAASKDGDTIRLRLLRSIMNQTLNWRIFFGSHTRCDSASGGDAGSRYRYTAAIPTVH